MIIMEAILSASALLHGRAAQSVGRSVLRTFKRWSTAYSVPASLERSCRVGFNLGAIRRSFHRSRARSRVETE